MWDSLLARAGGSRIVVPAATGSIPFASAKSLVAASFANSGRPPYAHSMGKWFVAFDGRWQESFGDLDEAIEWARGVAETGRTVDVAQRYFLIGRKFVTAFPESQRELREAYWRAGSRMWIGDGA